MNILYFILYFISNFNTYYYNLFLKIKKTLFYQRYTFKYSKYTFEKKI